MPASLPSGKAPLRMETDLMIAPSGREGTDFPPFSHEEEPYGCYFRLASRLHRFRIRTQDIPEPFLKTFLELIASGGSISHGPDASGFFFRLLLKIPANLLAWLFEKRFPARPFISHIDAKRIFPGVSPPSRALRKKWRLLKKRLIQADLSDARNPDHGLEITFADLGFLSNAAKRLRTVESEWRIHGRAVSSRAAGSSQKASAQPIRRLYWGGARSRRIAYWERLVHVQAGELSEVRRLAREVSSQTGRVVLSWHNASLAAAGGWAFEDLAAQFGTPEIYTTFVRDVIKKARQIRESFDMLPAARLCAMRSERLFAPKMARAAEKTPVSALLASRRMPFPDAGKYEWPGALSPHQRLFPEQVSAWMQKAENTWVDGLTLLFALADQGQRMLDSGKISCLVLPWIDKFFISSLRLADISCLERLFRLISANIRHPLILFWDDTPHKTAPSLGLALECLAERGLPVRAIGIFDSGASASGFDGAGRAEAARIILREYPHKELFTLRPLNENHCPEAFRWIFQDLNMKFFRNYDSSWKDNLAFIYTGTQVFPLMSVQTEMESISPWVFNGQKRYAFGTWFRKILRRISLGERKETRDALYLDYCSWANLL